MVKYTPYQTRYLAEQIVLRRAKDSYDNMASAISGVKVDLNPHQVDAALFAMKSPLSTGALLADEVGLGKTVEAGLVLAQYWAERKRRILIIVPASLRTQWRTELSEKFYIDSILLDSTIYNKAKKAGQFNPFEADNQVVICSYNFAARKDAEIRAIPWDLVIMDEAHRLRNVYKPSNVMGNKLKKALQGRKKLLLTATPLQNNLMELYGLVSIIDDHVFGDAKIFREMYVTAGNTKLRNHNLQSRLSGFCQRTLRKQVTEYVRYTKRHAILQEYMPTKAEEELYNLISNYLQTAKLYALPQSQRTLITMVLRKLLASSTFAIAGTLQSLIARLNALLQGIDADLDLTDYDTYDELHDENSDEESVADLQQDKIGILDELAKLEQFAKLAENITTNAKGDNLIFALQQGFAKIEELGGQRKAVIFTESRRTQEYLFNLLSNNGYAGQIVFLNGMNGDEISRQIYNDWKEKHKNDGAVSGSKQADMKAAVVEQFRDKACILIGTEAAAEGINLQFCSLVVNYDLPWNPQRIEQRIGRCHRYGQKNDVVVINFLNQKNAADRRVYELLDQKFQLFEGVFGSSDDVLGSIESGVDFEKRIAAIYQTCKTAEEIQKQFDQLQDELSEQIQDKMLQTRQSILENFDETVAARLKECNNNTVTSLDKFTRWIYYFFIMHGAERVEPLEQWRLRFVDGDVERTYNLKWQDAETAGDVFLRREDPLYAGWLNEALTAQLPPAHICFDYSHSGRHISFLTENPHLQGILSVDKLSYNGLDEEEHLILSILTDGDLTIDDDTMNSILELPAAVIREYDFDNPVLDKLRTQRLQEQQAAVEEKNKAYYLEECDKLDAYSEELKVGLKYELKALKKEITEKKKLFRASTDLPLAEMLAQKEEINKLEKKHKKMQREIYDREDEIDAEKERLQEETRRKLQGSCRVEQILKISFEIV